MNKDPNQILTSLMKGEDIGEQNAFDLMQLLATGTIDPAVAGAILTSLRIIILNEVNIAPATAGSIVPVASNCIKSKAFCSPISSPFISEVKI